MSIYNKDENWWLRVMLVSVVLGSMILLSSLNRVTTESTKLLQLKVDSLTNSNEILQDSIFHLNHEIGINELLIDDLGQQPRWKGLSKAIEQDRYEYNKFE